MFCVISCDVCCLPYDFRFYNFWWRRNYKIFLLLHLITHIVLSIVVIPFVLITLMRAKFRKFIEHKKIAKITFPLWLYVAVTGVIVYLMISPYYA